MNDFAKFFFCLSGFAGFLLFFCVALLIHRDPSLALFHGGVGCLLFALSGRALLGFVLNGVANRGKPVPSEPVADGKPVEGESDILVQEKLTAEQMSEAVANPKKPIVEAKA